MYHGTQADITAFDRGHANAIYLTDSPDFASGFAGPGEGANVLPVWVSAQNVFDYDNPQHVRDFEYWLMDNAGPDGKVRITMPRVPPMTLTPKDLAQRVTTGNWMYIESPLVQEYIRANHDGFYTKERGHKNLGVYSPTQIKSATGNQGTFDSTNPDIRRSVRTINVDGVERPTTNSNGQPIYPTEEGIRNFWRWFGDSKVVDDQGFEPCPDFKGIKTMRPSGRRSLCRSNHALISKGLRPIRPRIHNATHRFEPCPDFKGIKNQGCLVNRVNTLLDLCFLQRD